MLVSGNPGISIDPTVLGIVAYLPPDPKTLMNKIGDAHPRFICFLYEDDGSRRAERNRFLAKFTESNLEAYIETVPLPPDPVESFEWLYNKISWEVDYFLQSVSGSSTSNMLFIVSGIHVPVVVALYTVAMERNTKFLYFNDVTQNLEKPKSTSLSILPSLFKSRGEPYRSSAIRKYSEEYFGSASYDFDLAWQVSGDKSLQAMSLLSSCYDNLDRLAYSSALEKLEKLMQDENCMTRLIDITGSGASEHVKRLHFFLKTACSHFGSSKRNELEVLADRNAVNVFIRSLYSSAMRRLAHSETEQSALLLYRIIEVTAQHLLATHGIDTFNFDINLLDESKRRKVIENYSMLLRKKVEEASASLTKTRIGALDSWVIYLFGFYNKEPLFLNDESRLKYLGRLRSMIELRNRCFLEHGIDGVDKKASTEFAEFVRNAVVKQFMGIDLKKGQEDPDIAPLRLSSSI